MAVRGTRAALAAAACLFAGQARASATLTCDIKDRSVEFSMQVSVGSIAAALSGLRAAIDIKPGDGLAAAKFELPPDAVLQQWIDGPDLRLWLRADKGGKTPEVELAIVTRQTSESRFAGTYRLTVASPSTVNRRGRVSCELGY